MYEAIRRRVQQILRVEARQPEPLPGHAGGGFVQVIRPCAAYLRYRLFFWTLYALAAGLGSLAVVVGFFMAGPWYLLLAVPIVLVIAAKVLVIYVATRLDYEFRWYLLTDRSVLVRQGVWVVREICLTYANVQNVYVRQGPLERVFGFWNVEIDTAGGGGKKEEQAFTSHRAVLRGLEDPGGVRDRILDLLRHHGTAGLGDPDDEHPHVPVRLDLSLLEEIRREARQLRVVLER